MPRTLEITSASFLISHFSGGILPDPLLGQRGLMAPSVITAAYYAFSGHLYNVTKCYWNPCRHISCLTIYWLTLFWTVYSLSCLFFYLLTLITVSCVLHELALYSLASYADIYGLMTQSSCPANICRSGDREHSLPFFCQSQRQTLDPKKFNDTSMTFPSI